MPKNKSRRELDLEMLDVLTYQLEKIEDEREWNSMWVKDRVLRLNGGGHLAKYERNVRIPNIQAYTKRILKEQEDKRIGKTQCDKMPVRELAKPIPGE